MSLDIPDTAAMDQALALIRDAAQGLAESTEGPVLDTFTFEVGRELLGGSTHTEDELVTLLAAATMLLAHATRQRSSFSPQRVKELREDLDEAAAVAEVHAGVRRALNAGLNLLAEVERLNAQTGGEQ